VEQVYNGYMYSVYVLYNKEVGKTYTGQTEDLQLRVKQHNKHALGKFTASYPGEWVLIYSESVATRSEALKREKQLKSYREREFIKSYIPK